MKQRLKNVSRTIYIFAAVACLVAAVVTTVVASVVSSDESVGTADYTDIQVSGDFGAPVILSMPDNFQEPQSLESRVLIEGDGDEIKEGQVVLLRTSSFDSRTGKIIAEDGENILHLTHVNEEELKDFADCVPLIVGKKQGTRLLIVRPDKKESEPASAIIVMDILYTTISGESIDASQYATDVIPEVAGTGQEAPTIKARGQRINKLSTVTLIAGSGAQVDASQTIAIQYVITDVHGQVIDSTWKTKNPVLFDLNSLDLMKGMQEGIENQKVGSRVLVLVPSAMAKGEGDRILVVDILAATTKQEEEEK